MPEDTIGTSLPGFNNSNIIDLSACFGCCEVEYGCGHCTDEVELSEPIVGLFSFIDGEEVDKCVCQDFVYDGNGGLAYFIAASPSCSDSDGFFDGSGGPLDGMQNICGWAQEIVDNCYEQDGFVVLLFYNPSDGKTYVATGFAEDVTGLCTSPATGDYHILVKELPGLPGPCIEALEGLVVDADNADEIWTTGNKCDTGSFDRLRITLSFVVP